MTTQRLLLWNHHSPYGRLICLALPDWEILALPTPGHAPTGWRDDQRPRPPNLRIAAGLAQARADIALLQTAADVAAWEGLAAGHRPPPCYLAHNRAEYDHPGLPTYLHERGIPLVAISAMKRESWVAHGYGGPISVLLPGIPNEDYGAWTGEDKVVLSVMNGARRPLFDLAVWLAATEKLPVRLMGEGNDGIPGAAGPAASWQSLRWRYQQGRVYLSINRWPFEDGYNLALLEAMAAGMPCVALENPTAPAWARGFQGDTCNPGVLQAATAPALRALLTDALEVPALARRRGEAAQALVRDRFPFARFAAHWRQVLEEVSRG